MRAAVAAGLLGGVALGGAAWWTASARAAEAFPKPDPTKAFAAMKIYDIRGCPWRVAGEDWAGARRRVADDPAWRTWLAQEQAEVAAWREKRRDRVAWRAGWSHDFVSPKDGSKIGWTPAIPGEEVDHFRTPSDPRVELTPKLVAAWVHQFRTRHGAMLERAARLYRLTGDRASAEWAAAQLDFYAANLTAWPAREDGARLFFQTLTEATNLVRYAEVVRLLGDFVAPERRAHWLDAFFRPEVEVLQRTYQSVHNIACWQRSAAAQVALVFGDGAMWREAIDGEYGLRRQLAQGVTSDYLWFEQSLGYNAYVLKALHGLFVLAGLAGRTDELAGEIAVAQNLLLAPTYLRFPAGDLPNPADSAERLRAPDRALCLAVYRVFPTTLGLREAAQQHNWEVLVDPPARPPRPNDEPAVTSWNLASSRMALLRRGAWQVFFHYGQLTASHAQQEALNFSASFAGVDVTHDAGTVPYGSPLYQSFYTRGPAQNALLVNGVGQDAPQLGELIEFDPDLARVTAAQPKYQPGVQARRTLAIEGDRLVDTATLRVAGARPQVLGLTLHVSGEVLPGVRLTPDPEFARGRPEPFAQWREPRGAIFHDRAEFRVRYGERVLRVIMVCPGEFRLWLGRTPDYPPRLRDSFYLETLATRATFTTTFQPQD